MTANRFEQSRLEPVEAPTDPAGCRQYSDIAAVALQALQIRRARNPDSHPCGRSNSPAGNRLGTSLIPAELENYSNCFVINEMRRVVDGLACRIARSRLIRWCKFNLVGGIGIFVQFAALFALKSLLHLEYLLATALAVEIAVLHNFVWHERFTWADRTITEGKSLRRIDRQREWRSWRRLARLARFHVANGAVSIVGNLALMKVMVGAGHMNYLVANGIAIVLCSVANFLVSDGWVFGE